MVAAFYQLGALFPLMRAHGIDKNVHVREPWLFPADVQQAIRESLRLRYSLIHYLYTLFVEASEQGVPIMRPMFLEFPTDSATFSLEPQFMFGPAFLFSPKWKEATCADLQCATKVCQGRIHCADAQA
jgi:alpha-glucosidase (family GH31 glycosyl hydrolase)